MFNIVSIVSARIHLYNLYLEDNLRYMNITGYGPATLTPISYLDTCGVLYCVRLVNLKAIIGNAIHCSGLSAYSFGHHLLMLMTFCKQENIKFYWGVETVEGNTS